MKVLVIGSGGREHAIAWKLKQSNLVEKIYCAPGNAGTKEIAENIPINAEETIKLIDFAKKNSIDLTVVGPEMPLVNGIVNEFEKHDLKCFGPKKEAALIEGSKIFCRELLSKYNVPQPEFHVFSDSKKAIDFIKEQKKPFVVKADGLAAGKGVIVCNSINETINAVKEMLEQKKFGKASEKILLEEKLVGEELSYLVLTDGSNFLPLASAQDHKRVYDNDKGPNTGGMGAYSPAPIVSKKIEKEIIEKIIKPAIKALKENNALFKGVLYAGLMLVNNKPYLLEFNCRFGDPETQVILPRMKSDLMPLMLACIEGTLNKHKIKWFNKACTCVVLASKGYPEKYEKGFEIFGLEKTKKLKNTIVFHAGTKKEENKVLTNGGRVLNVCGLGKTIKESIDNAYKGVKQINFNGMHYRKDIGFKALKYQKTN